MAAAAMMTAMSAQAQSNGYLELGTGEQGIALVGLRYKF